MSAMTPETPALDMLLREFGECGSDVEPMRAKECRAELRALKDRVGRMEEARDAIAQALEDYALHAVSYEPERSHLNAALAACAALSNETEGKA